MWIALFVTGILTVLCGYTIVDNNGIKPQTIFGLLLTLIGAITICTAFIIRAIECASQQSTENTESILRRIGSLGATTQSEEIETEKPDLDDL